MEDHAFEVSASSVTNEILDGQRSLLREQPDVNIPKRRVNCRFVGERRWACALRRGGCRDRLFLSRRTFVENIAVVTGFIPESLSVRRSKTP